MSKDAPTLQGVAGPPDEDEDLGPMKPWVERAARRVHLECLQALRRAIGDDSPPPAVPALPLVWRQSLAIVESLQGRADDAERRAHDLRRRAESAESRYEEIVREKDTLLRENGGLRQVLVGIANLMPIEHCGQRADEVYGINDGKSRGILLQAALDAARKATGSFRPTDGTQEVDPASGTAEIPDETPVPVEPHVELDPAEQQKADKKAKRDKAAAGKALVAKLKGGAKS